jgi:hypothetical protein
MKGIHIELGPTKDARLRLRRVAPLNVYAGVGATEQQSRCGLTIARRDRPSPQGWFNSGSKGGGGISRVPGSSGARF